MTAVTAGAPSSRIQASATTGPMADPASHGSVASFDSPSGATAYMTTPSAMPAPVERESMLALCRQGSARGWWQGYGDAVPPWMRHYIGLEQAAVLIRSYDVQYIPGLLQAPAYARAVLALPGGSVGERAERLHAVRMQRQQILHRQQPPHLWAVIDEAALRRPIGGTAVMRADKAPARDNPATPPGRQG
jgi:hypothetical protein